MDVRHRVCELVVLTLSCNGCTRQMEGCLFIQSIVPIPAFELLICAIFISCALHCALHLDR